LAVELLKRLGLDHRALDQLLAHKDQLQVYLKERMGALFRVHYDLLLYDVTSTYFEGRRRAIPRRSAAIRVTTGPIANRC
jgi:hypothetical protein